MGNLGSAMNSVLKATMMPTWRVCDQIAENRFKLDHPMNYSEDVFQIWNTFRIPVIREVQKSS